MKIFTIYDGINLSTYIYILYIYTHKYNTIHICDDNPCHITHKFIQYINIKKPFRKKKPKKKLLEMNKCCKNHHTTSNLII